ncbi:MAG TPA: hypothetical protein ENI23_10155 [bacterium]|nr:hypothetical protein [bacterium]
MTEPTQQQIDSWNSVKAKFEEILANPNIDPLKKERFEFRLRSVNGLLEGKVYDHKGKTNQKE